MRQMHDAVIARLKDVLPAGEVFKIGEVPADARRYVVAHVARNVESGRFMRWPDRKTFTIVINCYGSSVEEAQWRQERVFAALDKWVPVIGGYTAQACRHAHSQAVDVDDDSSPPAYFGSELFAVHMDPS